jgi:AAA ATPase domain
VKPGALIGREAELATIDASLAAASGGRGRLVVISGDAGIGKSALVEAIEDRATAAGAVASYGRAWEFAESPPYFAVRAHLRDLAVVPEGPPFELWEHVLEALARASRERPRVWLVEDAHAADLMTLDLLAFLARPVRSLPVLIAVTRRDKDPRLTPASEQRLVHIARDGERIALAPLDERGVEAVAAAAAGRSLPRATVRHLVTLTGGNPLFVVECARALRTSDEAALPDTLRRVVQDRVGMLPDATRDVLAAAAVLGREFSSAVLAKLVDRLPARVIDELAPAIRAGVVREEAPGDFAFSHVVVRDAIEDAVPAAARASLHHRAANALATATTTAAIVERARHILDAAHVEPDPEAPAIVARAVDLLAERGAFDHAFALAMRLDEVRGGGVLPAATGDDRLRVAALAMSAGRSADAQRICDEICTAARGTDPALFARAVLVGGSILRPAAVDPKLVAALEEARGALGDDERALTCRVDARLAAARQPAPDPMGPVRLAEDAIARARELDDPKLLCEVIDTAGSALVAYASPARRLALADEQTALARSLDDPGRQLRARVRKAMDLIELGEVARFSGEIDEMLAVARGIGVPALQWRPLLMASMRAVAEGRLADSERFTVEVAEMAAMIDDPALRVSLPAHIGVRAVRAHYDDFLRTRFPGTFEFTAGLVYATPIEALVRAMTFARLEDRDATAVELARFGPMFEILVTTVVQFRGSAVEPVALAGTDEQRRTLRAALATDVLHPTLTVPDLVNGHVSIAYDGPRSAALGLLDASLGDTKLAIRELTEALALTEQRGHRLWTAQICYDLGRIAGDTAMLERAAKLAAEIGMPGLVVRANARLAREPVAVAAPRPRLAMSREGDVWRVDGAAAPVRVKDSRGMQLLARLVERPNEDIHVLALASDEPGASLHDRGELPVLDARARRDYKERLDELDDEIAAAEARNDAIRASALAEARESLAHELARAVGLGGASRKLGSAGERARVNVQRRVKDAIQRIAEADADLGRYLEMAVRTGTYCCFRP